MSAAAPPLDGIKVIDLTIWVQGRSPDSSSPTWALL
jgi:hypothetical protein